MNIIIAGDGEVGFYLAKSLTQLDFNITVVDPHSELLKRLEKETDLRTIVGNSTSPQVLNDANVGDCDLFLAVLHDESINLVTCMLARQLKAKKTVARITNSELLEPGYREMFRSLGVDEMVCPERIAATEITNLLNHNIATEFFNFSGGLLSMYLIRLQESSPVNNKSVKELSQIYSDLQVRIVAILHHGETVIPHADTVFHAGDMAYIISKENQMESVKKLAGGIDFDIHNVMIAGGGRIGRYAAHNLEKKMSITLIENDRARCEDLVEILGGGTLVINGDATDIDLLLDEGLTRNDAFIAVTDSSETNVLTCLHARRYGVKKTIALVENTGFINISQDIGIDTIINKKLITASYIARFIVQGNAVSSKWLSGTNAELIEFVVGPHAKATKVPIKSLNLSDYDATIGGIIRGRETILPTRDTQLQEKDKVVVFALPNGMSKVAKLFK
ncbi:MAG: Trk system potassium transporter TrkA [Bacteroidales bacterium]|nr:Trk system potassium transporter TrkA [Bacteroidales bacterium]